MADSLTIVSIASPTAVARGASTIASEKASDMAKKAQATRQVSSAVMTLTPALNTDFGGKWRDLLYGVLIHAIYRWKSRFNNSSKNKTVSIERMW